MQHMLATRGRAHQFSRVFDKSLVPMVIVDNDRRYLAANAAARLLLRLSLGELRRRQIDHLTPPHMLSEMEEQWARLIREGSVTGLYEVGLPDGSRLSIVYCALANVLPGQHLIVFVPAEWPEAELEVSHADAQAQVRAPLSPREQEVLTLIAAGVDLQQLADELTLSVSTVRTHARNALRKLGARNRAHAIALAMHQGLIDLPPRPSEGLS